jgi:hypothetical protein
MVAPSSHPGLARSVDCVQIRDSRRDSSLGSRGERVIDPATMLIYAESLSRTIKMRTEAPGQEPVWTTMQEKREYRFAYTPPLPRRRTRQRSVAKAAFWLGSPYRKVLRSASNG